MKAIYILTIVFQVITLVSSVLYKQTLNDILYVVHDVSQIIAIVGMAICAISHIVRHLNSTD